LPQEFLVVHVLTESRRHSMYFDWLTTVQEELPEKSEIRDEIVSTWEIGICF
jgi:hypothetical protein